MLDRRGVRDLVLLSSFGLWVLLPGVAQVCGYSTVEDIPKVEFREPAPAPVFPANLEQWRSLPAAAEAYLDDHFGLRLPLGRLHSTLLAALGTSASDHVLLGSEGWLYLSQGRFLDEFRGTQPLPHEEIAAWIDGVSAIHATLEERGIAHLVTLIPGKWSVYPEHLPPWARPRGPTRYSRLSEEMKGHPEIPFLDARALILPEKTDDDHRLFRKTDTHWTSRAALIAYGGIMGGLAKQRPGLRSLPAEDILVGRAAPAADGDLHRFLHSTPLLGESPYAVYGVDPARHEVLAARILAGTTWRDATFRKASATVWKTAYASNAANDLTVLVYADSFTNPMTQFLIHTFSRVVMVRHQTATLDSRFLRAVEPDIVLVNLNERTLRPPPRLVSKSRELERLLW
jgi:hypothetical protein